ncbi:MAG: hypothetical protein ABI880_01035 [Acidobacteriota bacterium]
MAYTLCLWDPARHAPMPVDADDALATMERLSGQSDSWNPRLVDAGTALMGQGDGRVAADGASAIAYWGSDLRQATIDCATAVYRLTLPGEDDDCIAQIGAVVTVAGTCGLVVVDDENGMCFLPDGQVFPEDMRELWAAQLADALAGPVDPATVPPDNRTFAQTLFSELFDAIGRGNRRIS